MRTRLLTVLTLPLLAGLLSACGAELAAGAVIFEMAAEPSVSVARGGSNTVEVTVIRFSAIPVGPAVNLTLEQAPQGVSFDALSVPTGTTSAKFTVKVAPEVAVGGPTKLRLKGTNGVTTKTAEFELTVTEPTAGTGR